MAIRRMRGLGVFAIGGAAAIALAGCGSNDDGDTGDGDVLVVATTPIMGSIAEQVQFRTTYTTVGGWGRWGRGRVGVSGSRTTPITIQAGTLMIDVWKASEGELVWRGRVSDDLTSNRERNLERMRIGIERAFNDFPPS